MRTRTRQFKILETTYQLSLGFNTAELAQELTGKPLFQVLTALTNLDLTCIRILFYAATRKEHAELTIDGAAALMEEVEIGDLVPLLVEIVNEFVGNLNEGRKKAQALVKKK